MTTEKTKAPMVITMPVKIPEEASGLFVLRDSAGAEMLRLLPVLGPDGVVLHWEQHPPVNGSKVNVNVLTRALFLLEEQQKDLRKRCSHQYKDGRDATVGVPVSGERWCAHCGSQHD